MKGDISCDSKSQCSHMWLHRLLLPFVVSYCLFIFFNNINTVSAWYKSLVKSLLFDSWLETCEFQNPILTFPTHSIFTLFFSSLVMTLTFRMILKERKLLNSQEKLQIGDQTTCFTHVPMLNLSNCLWVNTNIFLTFPADF